jgi:LacI family transcriptional regulator
MLSGMQGYQRRVLMGIQQYARARDDWHTRVDSTWAVKPQHATSSDFDGVIGELFLEQAKQALIARGKPLVALFHQKHNLPIGAAIGVDDRAIGVTAANHLVKKGFTHFACFGMEHEFSRQRVAGFESALKKHSHVITSVELADLPLDFSGGAGSHRNWLASLPQGTAVFCVTDRLAFALLSAAKSMEIDVPQDLAVLGVNNEEDYCELTKPGLSSVEIRWEWLGYRAGELLENQFDGNAAPSDTELIAPTRVVERASCECVAALDADVMNALKFMRDNLHKPIGVEDLVEAAGIPRRTLQRKFVQEMGHGIVEELHNARVQRAKNLLERGELSLEEVAEKSGFGQTAWMSRVFRRALGQSPSAYRDGFAKARAFK